MPWGDHLARACGDINMRPRHYSPARILYLKSPDVIVPGSVYFLDTTTDAVPCLGTWIVARPREVETLAR